MGKWFTYFLRLAFLPPKEVSDGFANLISRAPDGGLSFADYVLKSYIGETLIVPTGFFQQKYRLKCLPRMKESPMGRKASTKTTKRFSTLVTRLFGQGSIVLVRFQSISIKLIVIKFC